MSKIFLTSDLHFWHTNIIKFENRPWKTVEEMNQGLIKRWNAVVSEGDTVYILGDLAFCAWNKLKPILEQLKGHKILIAGNHDNRWLRKVEPGYFDEICKYKEIRYNGYDFVLFHHPISCWNGMEHGSIHLYGHIHSNSHDLPTGYNRTQSYNVGVDTNHYRPVDLDWIIKIKEMAKEPEKYIPKKTIYCYHNWGISDACPFWDTAENRDEQCCGVCHYLNTTDYEQNHIINHNDDGCWMQPGENGYEAIKGTTAELFGEDFPHSLLWDMCKECGINEEVAFDDEEEEE